MVEDVLGGNRWAIVDEIQARNRDRSPDEADLDVAQSLDEIRAERVVLQDAASSKVGPAPR